jgi:hypothetical protein
MKYEVSPGLYAVGSPDRHSPALVTANYKLTFDLVRRELEGLNVWILVLDTKGINVWCAAGKGTFGTKELVNRIRLTTLERIVDHKTVIIPQLGAVGVSAHLTTKETSFRVVFGPVRAKDIPAFLERGMEKTQEMSKVKFTFRDRLALVPLEVVGAWRVAILILSVSLLFGILIESRFSLVHGFLSELGIPSLYKNALIYPLYLFGGLFSGTVLSPLLLPFIPVKPFSLKGAFISLALSAIVTVTLGVPLAKALPLAIIASAISAYAALQFTGASTYTSENGVRREVKYSVPAIYSAVCLGIAWFLVNVALTMIHF